MGVMICGCNGCGKSTLGKALAKQLGWRFLDVEDYYFPDRGRQEDYGHPLPRAEAEAALCSDVLTDPRFILASVCGNFEWNQACRGTGLIPGGTDTGRIRKDGVKVHAVFLICKKNLHRSAGSSYTKFRGAVHLSSAVPCSQAAG